MRIIKKVKWKEIVECSRCRTKFKVTQRDCPYLIESLSGVTLHGVVECPVCSKRIEIYPKELNSIKKENEK